MIASRPYPWPYHGRLRPAHTALLVFSGDGDTEIDSAAIERLGAVIAKARRVGIAVIGLPRAGGDARLPVALSEGEQVIVRPHCGAFYGTDIDSILRRRGLTDLLIAGFPFELGADCTMREANDRGYECLVLDDCCSGVSAETFAGALKTLEYSGGIFGAVAPSASVIAAIEAAGAQPSAVSGRSLLE